MNNKKSEIERKLKQEISQSLKENITLIKNALDHPEDLKVRQLKIGKGKIPCALLYIEGIVDAKTVQLSILNQLELVENLPRKNTKLFQYIYDQLIAVNDVEIKNYTNEMLEKLLSGYTIFYVDKVDKGLVIETIGGEMRSLEEPITETLIRGPREGFVENLQTNLAIIRRSIQNPSLRFKTFEGGKGKKRIVVAYVDEYVDKTSLQEILYRIQRIDADYIQESGNIEAWIEDSFLSPFPQMLNTERPDKVVGSILEGRVAIFLDGTPFVLLAPITFANVLQSPEDYYERWMVGSLLRILRYFGAFISIFLPALYIALISIQPGMLPMDLALSIAGTREGVPFPPVVEAFMMVITMELLQEAGARLPQTIGQTIGIVGGLVIGEAAVQAGIVSPIMVIVVALTAIANFAVPAFSVAISFRIIRFAFMLAAAAFGLFGIVLVFIALSIHLVNLNSFGIPYTTPFAPFFPKDWKDVIIRLPIQMQKKQPNYLTENKKFFNDQDGRE